MTDIELAALDKALDEQMIFYRKVPAVWHSLAAVREAVRVTRHEVYAAPLTGQPDSPPGNQGPGSGDA